jgi:hypothetical protein
MYKVILAVIASRSEVYDSMVEIYWKKMIEITEKRGDIKIIMLYGSDQNVEELNIPNSNLFIGTQQDSVIPGIISKTIEAIRYINDNFEYKHILRTNLSSFFILDNLIKQSVALPKERCYSGVWYKFSEQVFGSGAGSWFSKDASEYLVEHCHDYMWKIVNDDILIGMIMDKYKLPLIPLGRFDFTCDRYILDDEVECDKIKACLLADQYHVRIKNMNDRQMDLKYMAKLTEMFYPDN